MKDSGVKDCVHYLYVGMWHDEKKKIEMGFSLDIAPFFHWY